MPGKDDSDTLQYSVACFPEGLGWDLQEELSSVSAPTDPPVCGFLKNRCDGFRGRRENDLFLFSPSTCWIFDRLSKGYSPQHTLLTPLSGGGRGRTNG